MPTGPVLDEKEKEMIETYRQKAAPIREIAQGLDRSDKVTRNYLNDPKNYDTTKWKPKKLKLTARDKQSIVKLASNSNI